MFQKTLLFLVALLVLGGCSVLPRNHKYNEAPRISVSKVLQQLFELLRKVILEGKAENGVPVLDPFYSQHIYVALQTKFVEFAFDMKNITVKGLAGCELIESTFNKTCLSIKFEIYCPSLTTDADIYELHGSVYDFVPLAGYGPMSFEISGIRIRGDLRFTQSQDTKSVLIKEIQNLYYNIEQVKSKTRYDGIIDHILNDMIEDLAADFANRVRKLAGPALADRFVEFINPILSQFDSWKFIAILV